MVFHEIGSITDVSNGHRTVIYYLENEGDLSNVLTLDIHKSLKSVLSILKKKNDDLLIIKVPHASGEFSKFQELYKAEVLGYVTLFAINNEGIPLVSQHICKEEDIFVAIDNLCRSCMLNSIPEMEKTKFSSNIDLAHLNENTFKSMEMTSPGNESKQMPDFGSNVLNHNDETPITGGATNNLSSLNKSSDSTMLRPIPQSFSTLLQIRLPDGSSDRQKFDRDAFLNEVWVFISTKYKLKDFDLKTYNHLAFSEQEYEMTLKNLDLYPNGVIIVVPKTVASTNYKGGLVPMVRFGVSQFMTKTTLLFNYIHGLFLVFWNRLFFSNSSSNSRNNNKVTNKDESNTSQSSQNRSSKASTKKIGNIHTLKRQDESDDENNRYNGNSTQQK